MKFELINKIYTGDCLDICRNIPDNSIDLIITSPPYAKARYWDYDSISPKDYPDWLTLRAKEFLRILKPTGTFILNIKENVTNGERNTYVIKTILKLKDIGWLWTEEFIWHKKSVMPGKWPNRFRDAWERCLQFNKTKKFKMYQESVMVPVSNATIQRLKRLNKNDFIKYENRTNSKFSINRSKLLNKDKAYPDNVLYFSTETRNQHHSAVFPIKLPEWFIKLFTLAGDLVLDPFAGSGTTGVASKRLNRNYLLIEKKPEYCKVIEERINQEDIK